MGRLMVISIILFFLVLLIVGCCIAIYGYYESYDVSHIWIGSTVFILSLLILTFITLYHVRNYLFSAFKWIRYKLVSLLSCLTWYFVVQTVLMGLGLILAYTAFRNEAQPSFSNLIASPGESLIVSMPANESFLRLAALGTGEFVLTRNPKPDLLDDVWQAKGVNSKYWGDTIELRSDNNPMKCVITIPDVNLSEPVKVEGFLKIPCIAADFIPSGDDYFYNIEKIVNSKVFTIWIYPKWQTRSAAYSAKINSIIRIISGATFLGIVIFLFNRRYRRRYNKFGRYTCPSCKHECINESFIGVCKICGYWTYWTLSLYILFGGFVLGYISGEPFYTDRLYLSGERYSQNKFYTFVVLAGLFIVPFMLKSILVRLHYIFQKISDI